MFRPRTRWEILPVDEEAIQRLAEKSKLNPLIVRLCWLRGLRTAEEMHRFLNKDQLSFHDPLLLKGMAQARERILKAIAEKEPLLIYGDYDADGVSATALMIFLFQHLGAHFEYYIPDRFSEGYGLNEEAVRQAADQGFKLILTVDTGITAVEEVAIARELGIDVIITDHHEPPERIPDACAVINPKLPDCTYPFPFLSGAGVALKLAQALLGDIPQEWIGIAAIGTIADLVPLHGENRLIAHLGLRSLTHSRLPGVRALLRESGLEGAPLDASHVGYALGPRINAGGRLERADIGVQLLTAADDEEARQLARRLNRLNAERQQLVKSTAEEAFRQAEAWIAKGLDHVLVAAGEDWNEGIIGIVASKLVERFYRPALVFSIDSGSGIAKGSGRSIEGFDIYRNVKKCEDLLLKFGGHPMACGMSIPRERIDELRVRLNELAKACLSPQDLVPKTRIDLECSLGEVNLELLDQLADLAPFGVENPEPIVLIRDVQIASMRKVGKDGEHIKWVFQQDQSSLDGIAFHWGESEAYISRQSRLHVIGELGVNEWNGYRKPQLYVRDLCVPHLQIFDHRGVQNRIKIVREVPSPEKTALLFFQERSRGEVEALAGSIGMHLFAVSRTGELLQSYSEIGLHELEQAVIYDLPDSYASFHIFRYFERLERVWCLFGAEINEPRLRRIPSREEFKWLYAYFYSRKKTGMDEKFWSYAKGKGLSEPEIRFMIQVFLELDFIRYESGEYRLVEEPLRRPFEHSHTYRRAKERIEVETELVFSPAEQLLALIERAVSCHELKEANVS